MRKFFILATVLFLSSFSWAGSGGTAVYNHGFDGDLIFDNEANDQTDTASNIVTIGGGEFNGNIITGQTATGSALANELRIVGGTINSANLKAGVSNQADAKENIVRLQDVTVQANSVAGTAAGTAADNTLTVSNATVNWNALTDNRIIAGETFTGSAEYNTLNITNGSVLNTTAAAGYSTDSGTVSYNTVHVTGASTIGNTSGSVALYGGYSKDGEVYNNQISLTDAGTVQAAIYGGHSVTSYAQRNLVETQKATISSNVYGGYTASGASANNNEVRIGSETEVSAITAGGWAVTGSADTNKVTISSGATVDGSAEVYGGYSEQSNVTGNSVALYSASAGAKAYGGYALAGSASNNSLSVTGTQTGGVLAGGWADAGAVSGNSLSVSDANLSAIFYGGYGTEASGNSATIANSQITGNLYGGYALSGAASENRAVISGSATTVTGNVYGGYATTGSSSGNTVELDSVTVTGDVYGGYTASSSTETATSNNTVILAGSTVINGNMYGGNGAISQGNALFLRNYNGTINALNNFDKVSLYGLSSNVTFNVDVQADVVLYGRPSEVSQTLAYTPGASSLTLNRDILGAYRYTIEGIAQGTQTAWSVRGSYENELAKPYAQSQLAGLALALQGDDILRHVFDEALTANSENDTFTTVQYYDNSYDTGSGFDMQSVVVDAGRWFKPNETIVWGLFAQYAHGHYSTDPKDATGGIDTFGVGSFALLPYSDKGYFEAVVRAGYQKNDFTSDELSSELDNDGFYGGVSAGLVQNLSALQLYGKVNWFYRAGDNVHDNLGQSIKFKDVQSLSGKVGVRLDLGTVARRYKPYLGIAGIYELDGDSNVSVDGHKVSDADLGGLTGQAEVGVTYENKNSMMPMQSSFSVFGLTGQAEGWGANIRLLFSF